MLLHITTRHSSILYRTKTVSTYRWQCQAKRVPQRLFLIYIWLFSKSCIHAYIPHKNCMLRLLIPSWNYGSNCVLIVVANPHVFIFISCVLFYHRAWNHYSWVNQLLRMNVYYEFDMVACKFFICLSHFDDMATQIYVEQHK